MKVHYQACPVCNSTQVLPLLKVRDHTVSKEQFDIWQCGTCTLRFTQDVPDEASIAPYYKAEDYISHTNTNKGLINQLYQKVRGITLKQKAALIKQDTGTNTGSLLDMGCGTGAFLATMKEQQWKVSGIEPDDTARSLAKSLYGIEALLPQDIDTFSKGYFDAITMWHVLEHVHRLHEYIEDLKGLLKDTGKLFIAVPNYSALDADVYRLNWAAYDVPRHLYHFTPAALRKLVEQHGLKVEAVKPMWFDALYISILSSRYKNGSTSWIGAALTGIRSNLKAITDKERCSSLIYIISKA